MIMMMMMMTITKGNLSNDDHESGQKSTGLD